MSKREQLNQLITTLLIDNITEEISPQDLRTILFEFGISFYNLLDDPQKENTGVAALLIQGLMGPVGADGNTLYKLRELIRTLETLYASTGGILDPLDTKSADYEATDADAYRIIPFNCSAGPLKLTVPSAIGRKGFRFCGLKVDASPNALTIVRKLGAVGDPQINFGNPLQCLYQTDRQWIQSNNSIYLPL